jgi:ADP-L-glycero-D-manno-heptose 6-epimerase
MASVAFHFFNQIKENGSMKLFEGSDEFRRDFIHVDDVVKVNMHFLDESNSGIFNCGTGIARSFLDIANVFHGLNSGSDISFIPFPAHLEGKYQAYTCANLDALRASGYKEQFLSLEEGMGLYYNKLKLTGGYHL